MKHGETPQHIIGWASADWLTSRVRARSVMQGDPMLRLVYLELLFVLYANGGLAPADPDLLADLLLLPPEAVRSALPVLKGLGSVVEEPDGATLSNPRVSKELARCQGLSAKRQAAARRRWSPPDANAVQLHSIAMQGAVAKGSLSGCSSSKKGGRPTWLTPFGEAWEKALGGEPSWGALARELKPLVERHGAEAVLAGWRCYLADAEPRYASPAAFARKAGVWVRKPKAKPAPRTEPTLPLDPGVAKRWTEARERIEMPPHLKRTWLSPVAGWSLYDGVLTLVAPSKEHGDALRRYEAKIVAAFNAVSGGSVDAEKVFAHILAPDAELHEGAL